MTRIAPLSLRFIDPDTERAYASAMFPRLKRQAQVALLVGSLVYLLLGLLDPWFNTPAVQAHDWSIRLTALCVPALVLGVSLTPVFERMPQLLLASVSVTAGVGLIAIQMQVPLDNAAYYYPAMVLLTFYTYNFIGVRFLYALYVDLGLLLSYNLVTALLLDYPMHVLLGHDVYIISANLIGGAAGYLAERQRRMLFVQRQQLEHERQYHLTRALHDPLTGLANRELLHDRIQHAIAESRRHNTVHYGFFIDLDGFKGINDQLTHEIGDQVLSQVAQRLTAVVREIDTVARIGGDEFFVLAEDMSDDAAATRLAHKIITSIRQPLRGAGSHTLTASVGICRFPYEGVTVEGVIRHADLAMYQVKSGSKNDFVFAAQPHCA